MNNCCNTPFLFGFENVIMLKLHSTLFSSKQLKFDIVKFEPDSIGFNSVI